MKLFQTTYDQAGNIDKVVPNRKITKIGTIILSVLSVIAVLACVL